MTAPGLPAVAARLRLPLVVAPMTGVSTPRLVAAAMDAGVLGLLPTHNVPAAELESTVAGLAGRSRRHGTPWGLNVLVHPTNPRRDGDLAIAAALRPDVVLASVGSPAPAVDALAGTGVAVVSAVATLRQARRAVDAGVDGLVLLVAGAGGQTGHRNPFAFAGAVRRRSGLPFAIAGGIGDGFGLWSALALGASLGVMGTRFIAAGESGADGSYRDELVRAGVDDVVAHDPGTGVPVSAVAWTVPGEPGPRHVGGFSHDAITAETHVRTAGHSVDGVTAPSEPCEAIVAAIAAEYGEAARRSGRLVDPAQPSNRRSHG